MRAEVMAALALTAQLSARLAAAPTARDIYRRPAPDAPSVVLQALSPLAEGADRLFAEEALAAGYRLIAPLPFQQADYEGDFLATQDAFRALLQRSLVIELDGARGADETASYEAVGRFVVQNCDLLIAIWDGRLTGKRGGTAEITRYAVECGVPIWWIDPNDEVSVRWLGDEVQWSERKEGPGLSPQQTLEAYLTKIILPPETESLEEENLFGRAARHIGRLRRTHEDPLSVFLTEPMRRSGQRIALPWRLFGFAYKLLAPPGPRSASAPVPPPGDYWQAVFERADQLSVDYADRYRSSYLLIILLAFCIDLTPKVARAISEHLARPATIIELMLLMAIAVLVVLNHIGAWHERWINYRLLAELCRGQSILSPIGEKMPRSDAARSAAATVDLDPETVPRDVWVGWFMEAATRASPWPERENRVAKQRSKALGTDLAQSQVDYHRGRSNRSRLADRRLGKLGERCFLATVVAVAAQVVLLSSFHEQHGVAERMEDLATSLSALSAGFIAIQFYSEFGLLHRQSERMRRNMEDVLRQLAAIDIAEPLASISLAKTLQDLSTAMLLDLKGWAELFSIRAVEAG